MKPDNENQRNTLYWKKQVMWALNYAHRCWRWHLREPNYPTPIGQVRWGLNYARINYRRYQRWSQEAEQDLMEDNEK